MERPSRVRVVPEYCSSGIWLVERPESYYPGGHLSHECLGLPADLSSRFERWIDEFDKTLGPQGENAVDWGAFSIEMVELARELKRFLGDYTEVEYWFWGRVFVVGDQHSVN